jgi:predicted phosphodiesterase
MKRVAALYDIHGNLPALEAALDDVREAGVDHIVAGGDVVVGPMSRETLRLLLDLDIPVQFIHGNCERELLAAMAGAEMTTVPEQFRPLMQWSAEQLRPDRDELAAWPSMLRIDIRGLGQALFCHATPRNDVDPFTRLTPEDLLRPLFQHANAPLVVCGHSHMQFDRMIGDVRVVNAGSVGMPFQEPGAYWLLLGPDVELRRTAYDLDSAAARIRATDYPDAENYAANHVLKPPSEAAMLEALTKASIKALTPTPA